MALLALYASRHSVFYSPLLASFAGGFLRREGLDSTYAVLGPGETSRDVIASGRGQIVQSAVSSSWIPLERGATGLPVHFAGINRRDGFFLVGRRRERFLWTDLEAGSLLADHATQPLAMLRYAALRQGVAWDRVARIDAGAPEPMEAAFRQGQGDYVHLQGPAAQQLEADGAGVIVAAVGEAMPPVAFSSLCAAPEFLATPEAAAFLRAFGEARAWVQSAPAEDVAAAVASLFPTHTLPAVIAAVRRYQQLGCWSGGYEITPELYEQAQRVFLDAGLISRRHHRDRVVAALPQTGR